MRKPSFLKRIIYFGVIRPVAESITAVAVAVYIFGEKKHWFKEITGKAARVTPNGQISNLKEKYSNFTHADFYIGENKQNHKKMAEKTNNLQDNLKNVMPGLFNNNEWISKILLRMGDAVIATDEKGIVLSMNKVAEDLTGWKIAESEGRQVDHIFNAINDITNLPIKNPLYKALKENKEILLANHTVLINKDKTQRIIVDSAVPIHDNDANVIGGALIFRDVTEQALDKKKLVENEGLLTSIMENTSLIIYIKDTEGKYLMINRQKEKVFNIKASRLIGKKSSLHLDEEQAAESMRTDQQSIMENRLVEFDQEIQHADGTSHSYHTSKFPLYDSEKKVYAVCAISADISESKKNVEMKEKIAIQEAILKSEIRFDELTKNMPNIFFSLDRSLRYTSFNKACETFTGKKAEEVIGKTMQEVFSSGELLFIEEYKDVLKTGKAKTFTSAFTVDENTFTFFVNVFPAENGISVLMTDLTSKKKSEAEMLELVDNLQKKNKDLRQFAYTVSHDLRAPIARVLGLVTLS
ncbi:MAG: PAS domain S-box protein, partial [Bacteroidia bacterium]|nr:PAS domain S-box protein [Bacteroidia bacterium]